jgi:transposase
MVDKPPHKIGAGSLKPSAKPVPQSLPHGALRVRRVPRPEPAITPGTLVCLGLDVHAAQITVVRQIDRALPQPAQRFSADGLLTWIAKMTAAGARVVTCYEAGCFGYVLHRRLEELGVPNLVVAPEAWSGPAKTDKRDARELCLRLERWHAGNHRALSPVRIPTVEQERRRAAGRQRESLLKERLRAERRGASLLLLEGVRTGKGWWRPAAWAHLAPQLEGGLRERAGFWQQQALVYEERQSAAKKALEEEMKQSHPALPAGLGLLTWRLLSGEILTWARFGNRRQVGSYTGLCPKEDSSGESRRQGPINRHGNPRVRTLLIEAVWRLARYEKGWRGFGKCPALLDKKTGSRQRRKQAAAAARLLAIDLWRLETRQTTAARLGLQHEFVRTGGDGTAARRKEVKVSGEVKESKDSAGGAPGGSGKRKEDPTAESLERRSPKRGQKS